MPPELEQARDAFVASVITEPYDKESDTIKFMQAHITNVINGAFEECYALMQERDKIAIEALDSIRCTRLGGLDYTSQKKFNKDMYEMCLRIADEALARLKGK